MYTRYLRSGRQALLCTSPWCRLGTFSLEESQAERHFWLDEIDHEGCLSQRTDDDLKSSDTPESTNFTMSDDDDDYDVCNDSSVKSRWKYSQSTITRNLGRWLRQLRCRDFTTTNDFARKGSDSPESRDCTTINNDNNYTDSYIKSLWNVQSEN